MGIIELIQDSGQEERIVRARKIRKALDELTIKLEKKAARLRRKLTDEDISPEDHKHLSAKLKVVEAQLKRGQAHDTPN